MDLTLGSARIRGGWVEGSLRDAALVVYQAWPGGPLSRRSSLLTRSRCCTWGNGGEHTVWMWGTEGTLTGTAREVAMRAERTMMAEEKKRIVSLAERVRGDLWVECAWRSASFILSGPASGTPGCFIRGKLLNR